eukprot:gene6117-12384_t
MTLDHMVSDGSEDYYLSLIKQAEKDLKVFVYPFPPNIRRCKKNFKPGLKEMFDMEIQIPKYYKEYSLTTTSNPEEANVFIVDHEWICLRVGSEPPKQSPERIKFSGNAIAKDHIFPIWKNVIESYPYFNRSYGHDHFTTFVFDNGPFCGAGHIQPFSTYGSKVMQILQNVSIIGSNGYSGLSQWDKHCEKPCVPDKRFDYCHREGKDIVIPQAHNFHIQKRNSNFYNISSRQSDSFYRGSIKTGLDCSPGIRLLLDKLHTSSHHDNRHTHNSIDTHLWQTGRITDAIFALCPAGNACWSMRLYHAILSDTIPVILADHIFSLRAVSPWLTFDHNQSVKNAYRLVTLEMWCRTAKGEKHSVCKRPSAWIANESYY